MNVVILSKRDYAGSAYKLYSSLIAYGGNTIDVVGFVLSSGNKYGHEQLLVAKKHNMKEVDYFVKRADVVHIKGDWPLDGDSYYGVSLKGKTVIISVSGSLFRKKEHGGSGKFELSDYDNCDVRTAMTPDLCYGDFQWLPLPINSDSYLVVENTREVPLLVHSPTNRVMKDSKFISDVFVRIQQQIDCKFDIVEGVKFKEAEERSKKATIFFDQFRVGFYGNSAIQAMRYGIPVASWIKPDVVARDDMHGCPVLTWEKDALLWADKIVEILSGDMHQLRINTKLWCDNVHSYPAVARKLIELYKKSLDES